MKKEYTTRIMAKNEFYNNIQVDKETRNAIKFYNLLADMYAQGKIKICKIIKEKVK